jgi:hypothetical protein
MPAIYLQHPLHGTKVAVSDMEAEEDMARGWEPFDPSEPAEASDEPVYQKVSQPDPEPVPVLVNELQPRRRGRRPREVAA